MIAMVEVFIGFHVANIHVANIQVKSCDRHITKKMIFSVFFVNGNRSNILFVSQKKLRVKRRI
jgi:hypothetical protein